MRPITIQQSIANTRKKLHEFNRLVRIARRRNKDENASAQTNLELLIDHLVAETGIELTEENLPTIVIYVREFLQSQQQQRVEGDPDGMKDFPF